MIVFAKEPEKGRVKTRLREHLSEEQCFKLYKAFLRDTLESVKTLEHIDKVLAYDFTTNEPGYLKKIGRPFTFYKQRGKNLGEKMHNAFKFARKTNSEKAIIIGSDSPNLPVNYVKEAFRRLDNNDIVLGPSRDGGYYLVGLKNPCLTIFRGVKWSSETVLKDTIKNAGRLNKKIAILRKWYDIDDSAGLARLKRDLKKKKNTARWTRKLLGI